MQHIRGGCLRYASLIIVVNMCCVAWMLTPAICSSVFGSLPAECDTYFVWLLYCNSKPYTAMSRLAEMCAGEKKSHFLSPATKASISGHGLEMAAKYASGPGLMGERLSKTSYFWLGQLQTACKLGWFERTGRTWRSSELEHEEAQ